jgi:hypothetical protein
MNLYDLGINHPGRNEALQYFDKHYVAATPPSKGGETYTNISCHKATPRLTAKGTRVGYQMHGKVKIRKI